MNDHSKWTQYLDEKLREDITTNFDHNFTEPIIKAIQDNTKMPAPMNYCKSGTYPELLNKMNNSGLLHWRLDEARHTKLSNYAHLLQITIFAITKDINTDRLISWPRLANHVSLLPPKPDLPDSSLFEYLCVQRSENIDEAGIYLDVANMFHNMPLPIPMTDLFPLPTISYGELNESSQAAVLKATGAPSLHNGTIIRPSQATMPMGFTWAVVLAHSCTTNLVKAAYNDIKQRNLATMADTRIVLFNRENAPYMLNKGTALALAIIDDISVLFAGWNISDITTFHAELVQRLTAACLPIAIDKSITVGTVETQKIPFIGNIINLVNKTITPMNKRISKLAAFFHKFDIGKEVPYPVWASLVGKLVSYSMLHRGLLAQFNYVYKHTPRPVSKLAIKPADIIVKVSEKQKGEVQSIISLLPLAQVIYSLPHSKLVVAFDASNIAAAVVYTYMSDNDALTLWQHGVRRKATKEMTPKNDPLLESLIQRHNWKIAVHHPWRFEGKLPHINIREAIAANLAIDWVSRKQKEPERFIALTDSGVVLGAYSKGRSSIIWMLEKIRRYQSICLATGSRATFMHVRTEFNPADPPSRKHKI